VNNPRVLTTLLLVFLAGVATGMLGMRYGLHEKLHQKLNPATVSAAPAVPQPDREAVLKQFKTKLDLSTDQTQKIAMILEDYRHYYDSLQDQIDDLRLRDQIEDLRSTGRTRIMEILDERQRDKFGKMMDELAPQLDSSRK
jgi:hypothetical protein